MKLCAGCTEDHMWMSSVRMEIPQRVLIRWLQGIETICCQIFLLHPGYSLYLGGEDLTHDLLNLYGFNM